MYYDRTVSPNLIEALKPKGPFAFLAEFSRNQWLADLQLRGYPNTQRCWATMYCGLTKLLDVHERKGQFRLTGTTSASWDDAWQTPAPAAEWYARRDAIDEYLHHALTNVAARFLNEGAVQAMLGTRSQRLFSVLDREAVVGFTNKAERDDTYERLRAPLAAACAGLASEKWGAAVPSFGGELDLLAVDDAGRMLVIEVKPKTATKGIAWAPLQATFYAELFKAWGTEAGTGAKDALDSMLRQRVDLGLTHDPVRELRDPLELVPVVAIGGPPRSPAALQRLRQVQHAMLDAEVGWPSLEVWQVEESIARDQLSV